MNTKERSLVPRNGAKFALISELSYEDIDIQHLKSLKYYDKLKIIFEDFDHHNKIYKK